MSSSVGKTHYAWGKPVNWHSPLQSPGRGRVDLSLTDENYHELPAAERQKRIREYYDEERGGQKKQSPDTET